MWGSQVTCVFFACTVTTAVHLEAVIDLHKHWELLASLQKVQQLYVLTCDYYSDNMSTYLAAVNKFRKLFILTRCFEPEGRDVEIYLQTCAMVGRIWEHYWVNLGFHQEGAWKILRKPLRLADYNSRGWSHYQWSTSDICLSKISAVKNHSAWPTYYMAGILFHFHTHESMK